MSKITNITSKILSPIGNAAKSVAKAYKNNPEAAIAYTTVGSIIIKDGVGCYRYVTQSLNNDRIPEDKRKFVAALDLTNGVLMIAAQIALFALTRKYSAKIFDSLYNKTFGNDAVKNLISRIRAKQRLEGSSVDTKMNIAEKISGQKQKAQDTFKFVLELVAATIVGKRVIVPLIATPLADIVKNKMDERDAKKAEQTANVDNNDVVELQNRYKKYYGPVQNK